MKRKTEYVLGLIGSIIGLILGAFLFICEKLDTRTVKPESDIITGNFGMVLVIICILGIIGAILVSSKAKIAGLLMLVASLGCLINIFVLNSKLALIGEADITIIFLALILPSIVLLFISGLMGLLKKD